MKVPFLDPGSRACLILRVSAFAHSEDKTYKAPSLARLSVRGGGGAGLAQENIESSMRGVVTPSRRVRKWG